MVIAKTPFRISFFGGGTDYPEFYLEHGGSVISTTIDKYCYVTARHIPHFFDYTSQIAYSKTESVNSIDEIEHPAVRETMRFLDMRNLRVGYDADLPARAGLGSSSSFVVGMLNGFYALKGKYVDKKKLADDAIYIERTLCKESGGIQDQIAVSFGGLNRIDFGATGYRVCPVIMKPYRMRQLNENLMLFFTGFSRISAEIASRQKEETKNRTSELKHMLSLVTDAEKVLVDKYCDLNEFGRLLDETWQLKKRLTSKISTGAIDLIYEKAKRAGATGGKLLGAGGGGFILFYVEKERQKAVTEALGDLMQIPFRFEDGGSRIMYYAAEDFEVDCP